MTTWSGVSSHGPPEAAATAGATIAFNLVVLVVTGSLFMVIRLPVVLHRPIHPDRLRDARHLRVLRASRDPKPLRILNAHMQDLRHLAAIGSVEMIQIADLEVPASPNGKEVLVPPGRADWRRWLATNPGRDDGLWVVYRKKSSDLSGPIYDDLVEESLCFGWIDSQLLRVDDDRVMQWFSPRRPGGIWSALNKKRIERLVGEGQMTDRGRAAMDAAKADGSWSQIDDVDALVKPADLDDALAAAPEAQHAYEALSESARKQYLWWIHSAKRPATRANRIEETIRQLI